MVNKIEKKLAEAGYRMFGDAEGVEKLILDILETKNNRYLKAIPFLIYKYKPDIHSIIKSSKKRGVKELLQATLDMTFRLFKEFGISLPESIFESLKGYNKTLAKMGLDYQEFKEEFELQLKNENKPSLFIDKQKIYAERDLQMHISRLFTKKEKLIIKRLFEEKPISRTDYEYYSRKTKKKLDSIINLQEFAKSLYAKTPICDKALYKLKGKLEELIKKDSNDKNISITDFYFIDDTIFIGYENENNNHLNFEKKIDKETAKDKFLLKLLKKYKRHDFR